MNFQLINFHTNQWLAKTTASMPQASDFDLRVLLTLAAAQAKGEEASTAAMGIALGVSPSAVELSIAFWRGAGVVQMGGSPTASAASVTEPAPTAETSPVAESFSSLPIYNGTEVEAYMARNSDLRPCIDQCQRITGKIFTHTEVAKIVALAEHLSLSCEYILLLFSHCANQGKLSASYAVKAGYGLATEDGIGTYEALEEHIEKLEQQKETEGRLRTLFGAGGRKLTPTEKKYFEAWQGWGFDFAAIEEAYNIAVDNIGEPKKSYMNKVLENWHKEGFTAPPEVDKPAKPASPENKSSATTRPNSRKGSRAPTISSFDTDEFFRIALEAGKKKAENIRGNNDKQQ